jgi:G:T-mismatch repair DNA endonuclease (very short patch repair protein)
MCARISKSNISFWASKIANNKRRDLRVNRVLRTRNWVVIRIWEHQLRGDGAGAVKKFAVLDDLLPGLVRNPALFLAARCTVGLS